jgi:hypothetical protein
MTSGSRPPTFLYEYYWTHVMQGSTIRHLWSLITAARGQGRAPMHSMLGPHLVHNVRDYS